MMLRKLLMYPSYRRFVLSFMTIGFLVILLWTWISTAMNRQAIIDKVGMSSHSEVCIVASGVDAFVQEAIVSSGILLNQRQSYNTLYGNRVDRLKEAELYNEITRINASSSIYQFLGVVNGVTDRYLGTRGVYFGVEEDIYEHALRSNFGHNIYVRNIRTRHDDPESDIIPVITVLFRPADASSAAKQPSLIVTDISLKSAQGQMTESIRKQEMQLLFFNRDLGNLIPQGSVAVGRSELQRIVDTECSKNSEYGVYTINDEKYLVSLCEMRYADIYIIGLQRLSHLLPQVSPTTYGILACTLASLLLFMLTGTYVSMSFYKPMRVLIDRLLSNGTEKYSRFDDELRRLRDVVDEFRSRQQGRKLEDESKSLALRRLLMGDETVISDPSILYDELGILPAGSLKFCVGLLSSDTVDSNLAESAYYVYLLSEYAKKWLPCVAQRFLVLEHRRECELVIVLALQDTGFDDNLMLATHEMTEALVEQVDIRIRVSYGSMVSSLSDLQDSYRAARKGMSRRIFHGDDVVVYQHEESASAPSLYPRDIERRLIDALLIDDRDGIKQYSESFFEAFSQAPAYELLTYTQRLLLAILSRCALIYELCQTSMEEQIELLVEIRRVKSLVEVREIYDRILSDASKMICCAKERKSETSSKDDIIKTVCEYIDAHYSESELTLQQLADHVNLSAMYLGRVFYRTMGETINDYILHVRLHRAAEQLVSTEHTIKDISEGVGIVNSSYFYKLFKKEYGMTPTDYRSHGGNQRVE